MAEAVSKRFEKLAVRQLTMSRILLGLFFSALSGLFFYLAFPPVNVWPFVFFAAVPYLIAQNRLLPKKWSAWGPALCNLLWLWPFLGRIFGIPGAPFYMRHMGLLIAIFTLFTSTERKFHEQTGYRWFMLHGLAAWVGFEVIRSFIPVMGTMGFIANPLAGQAWLIQPVSIFSIYALNLLAVLVNFTLALVIMRWMDRKWAFNDVVPVDAKSTRRWAAGTVVAVVAWVALSLVIYNQTPKDTQTVRVAALHMQMDGPGHQVDEAGQAQRMALLTEQMHEAAAQGAEVVYAPEMGFGFDPQAKYTDELRTLTAETNTYLYFTYAYEEDGGWHNETVLLSPQGEFSPIYGKQRTFGEPPVVTAGTMPIHELPYGSFGAIICMDGVFTDPARETASKGAQILGIPTYNATVGISEQNWTHYVMRSVENQVPVVNADRGYYTMITDSHGKILADVRTPEGSSDVVVADVTLASGNSLYTSIGDVLGYIILAGYIFFMIYPGIVDKRIKQAEKSK